MALTEEILQHYLDRRPQVPDDDTAAAAAAVVVWNSALTVIAKQGHGPTAGGDAERVLRRMAAAGVLPNEISYACVLEAWAGTASARNSNDNDNSSGPNAERLLREMVTTLGRARRQQQQQLHGTAAAAAAAADISDEVGDDELNGTAVSVDTAASTCYLHVLLAWCRSAAPDGADRANAILQNMVQNFLRDAHRTGDDDDDNDDSDESRLIESYPNVKPTRHCFSAVMSGYANRGKLAQVEELLLGLQNLYQRSGGDPLLSPTVATFNSVLEAYARQGTPESAEKAQRLLERLLAAGLAATVDANSSSDSPHCLPDTTSVNTCLHAWAQSGARDAVERAEALLLSSSHWPGVRPDPYSYTTVMKAWAQSKRPEAAERCQGILRAMWERYEQPAVAGVEKLREKIAKPNNVTYSTAIFAWSSATNGPEAPLRAEAIYRDMQERHRSGDLDLKPSLSVYISLITVWARSSRKESDLRAQLYFDQMRGHYMAGDESLRPTDKVYNALLTSKKIRGDGEGAERVLKNMYDDCLTHGNTVATPNRFIFHNVMSAWAASGSSQAPERIEAILTHMRKEHAARKWDCKPNRVSLSILLNCLAKQGTREAAERADGVLRQMYKSSDESVQPCSYTCATALNAWSSTTHVPEAPIRAQAIFDDMMRRYEQGDKDLQPNSYAYNCLATTWAKSAHHDAGRRALAILNEMQERFERDPQNHEPPGPFLFTAVINAFAAKGDAENAQRVLQRMINAGIPPHRTSLNAVLKAYSRCGAPDAVEQAEQLLRDIKAKHSHSPNVVSYTTFLLCLRRSGRPDAYRRSKAVVEAMMVQSDQGDAATTPNEATIATLLATLIDSADATLDKSNEAVYVEALMSDVKVQPTAESTRDLHKIRGVRSPILPPQSLPQ